MDKLAARIADEPGSGTRNRIHRAIAAMATASPTVRPPSPEEAIAALPRAA